MAANLRAEWEKVQCPAYPLEVKLLSPRKYDSDQQVAVSSPREKARNCG
jgi:hypothetical protein